MQHDLIFKAITRLPYPILYRHDRAIYQQHPEVDPLRLMQSCLMAAFAGYWVGKACKRREMLFAWAFTLPVVAIFLYDEWKLAKGERNYENFKANQQTDSPLRSKQRDILASKSGKQGKKLRHVRPFPKLEHKIYNARDFTSQLDDSYFNQ